MRTVTFFRIAVLLAPAFAGCQSCPPEARALIASPDFSSPRAGGRTFLAAFACDEGYTEYLALAEMFKREHGATYDAYTLFRPELREQMGSAVRHAFRLEVQSETASEEGVVVVWGYRGDALVEFLMVRQDYAALGLGEREVSTFLDAPPGDWVQVEGRSLRLEIEDSVFRGVDPSEIERIVLESEWKIGDVRTPLLEPDE